MEAVSVFILIYGMCVWAPTRMYLVDRMRFRERDRLDYILLAPLTFEALLAFVATVSVLGKGFEMLWKWTHKSGGEQ